MLFRWRAAARFIKRNAIIHTDRGSQYAAVEFRRLLYIYGFRQSMSAKATVTTTRKRRAFFSRFKAELIEDGIFESIEEARTEIFSYIDGLLQSDQIAFRVRLQKPARI
jgi:putative transposase